MARRATWIVLLALVLAPLLGSGYSHFAAAQDDGTPASSVEEPSGDATPESTETPTQEATAASEPTQTPTDLPTEVPTLEPTSTPTLPASPGAAEVPTETSTPTSTATSTATATSTPVVTTAEIAVTIDCKSSPEKVKVVNNGGGSITVISIGSLYLPGASEPFPVNKKLASHGLRQWVAGPTATGISVLSQSLFLTNTVGDQEGVVVLTSVGSIQVLCPPLPPPPPPVELSDVVVSINCTSDPERIRVTNNGDGPLLVKSIETLYSPIGAEPFNVNTTLKAGKNRLWQAGEGATHSYVLTTQYILTNSAYDDEGVKVVTDVGTVTVRCPEAPPAPFGGDKWIEVNLSTQYLIAWQGNSRINETYVSTGRPGFETPTGTWYVNTKLYSQTMSGCIQGECYYVPDVPWVMYFTDWGHALHGTYWHNNFGNVMSHGCVNLPLDFAEWLFYWTPYGTPVVIHY